MPSRREDAAYWNMRHNRRRKKLYMYGPACAAHACQGHTNFQAEVSCRACMRLVPLRQYDTACMIVAQ